MTNEETHVEENAARDEEAPRTPSASGGQRRRGTRSGGGRQSSSRRHFRPRRKVCSFCVDKVKVISYKDADTLRRLLDNHGKIIPRRKTGTCAKHQRRLAVAVKRARHLALLPFTARRFPHP